MLPETMTVIEVREPGGPEQLTPGTRPVPKPAADEVLIAVAAAGINRPDVLQRQGLYPPPKGASDLLGLEVSGPVVATGESVTRFKPGDFVCALVNGGGYAEYAVAPEATTLLAPQGLSPVETAALPETIFTVWHNVFERGCLKEGDWLLVHGGASGIGTTAIQLGTAFGAKVIVTVGDDAKAKACEELGAAKAINYREENFVDVVKEVTSKHGADVILDMVGGDYVAWVTRKDGGSVIMQQKVGASGERQGAAQSVGPLEGFASRPTLCRMRGEQVAVIGRGSSASMSGVISSLGTS